MSYERPTPEEMRKQRVTFLDKHFNKRIASAKLFAKGGGGLPGVGIKAKNTSDFTKSLKKKLKKSKKRRK